MKRYKGEKEARDKIGHSSGTMLKPGDTMCGIGIFKPRFLQVFSRIGWFTFVNSIAYLMMTSLLHYFKSQITTLERQFGLSSKQISLIMVSNRISYVICVLLMSYLGDKVHIPRTISLGVFIMGMAGIICTLPHFVFGSQLQKDGTGGNDSLSNASESRLMHGEMCVHSNTSLDYCSSSTDGDSANQSSLVHPEIASTAVVILVTGMLLMGLAKGPRLSFAITYVDNNTEKTNTGLLIGIILTCSRLAPVITYLFGGIFANIYVTLKDTNLTPRHPKWIGAWWLGYLVFGSVAILISLPLSLFPRAMPAATSSRVKEKIEEDTTFEREKFVQHHDMSISSTSEKEEDKALTTKDHVSCDTPSSPDHKSVIAKVIKFVVGFGKVMLRLITNPIYMLMNICGVLIIFSASLSAFKAKYLEIIFHLPAHRANYTMAAVTLVSNCFGFMLGGYLTKRFKMTAYSALRFTTLCLVVALAAKLAGFLLYCEQPKVVNRPGDPTSCNAPCQCETNTFFPVCGNDGLSYYSPCHAGCLEVNHGVYSNCSCIPDGKATRGVCDYQCPALYGYLTSAVVASLFHSFSIMPKLVIFIRSVNDADKTVAIGFGSFTANLGRILGELVLGAVIDQVCDIWDVTCAVRGRCLLYNNDSFRINIHSYSCVALALALVFSFAAWFYAKFTGVLDSKENDDDDNKDNVNDNIHYKIQSQECAVDRL